jgi:hypothetical protein
MGVVRALPGSESTECPCDGKAIDLSGWFVNFLVTDSSGASDGDRAHAASIASQLAQDFYHLADDHGTIISLVDGSTIGVLGSAAYRFHVVLLRNARSGAADATVQRETLGRKFAPHLGEDDHRASRLKWSSVAGPEHAAMR